MVNINIGEFMTRRALLTPGREGLVCGRVRRSYRELNERANKFANAMLRLGVGHGDRVAVLALNEPEYYDMLFGLGKIAAILVPINYRLAGPEIEFTRWIPSAGRSRPRSSLRSPMTLRSGPPRTRP